jgi:hypothetical protein
MTINSEGKNEYLRVWNGSQKKTSGGLARKDLKKNKAGRIVSRKRSAEASRRYRSRAYAHVRELFEENQFEKGHRSRRRRSAKKSRSRRCKYGKLKNPVKTPSGGKRYCKKKSRSQKHKSRSKGRCKYGKLKNPVKTPSGQKRYCKKKSRSRRK